MTATTSQRPLQRVGHIGDDDNRFCGAAVFADLAERFVSPLDLLGLGFGMPPLDDDAREIIRCVSLCLTSPDARVWPLKMTRLLSSYGNSMAGYFGAQLASFSDRMGPGTASYAAASLRWLQARLPTDATAEQVTAAVAEHVATRGRIAGFGVPFRREDERLLSLHRLLAGHPALQRPFWRLHLRVVDALRASAKLEPNIVFPMTALLTDLGLSAERTGLFFSLLMNHTFAAHAMEAAEQDAAHLQTLPPASLDDRSRALRRSPRAVSAATRSAQE